MAVTPTLTALQVMQDAPVIPVIVLQDVAHEVPLARALVAGGVRMRSFGEKDPTLEDVFMLVTKGLVTYSACC